MEIELIHILQSKYGIIFAAAGLAMLLAVVLSAWVANFWQQAHATLAGKLTSVARIVARGQSALTPTPQKIFHILALPPCNLFRMWYYCGR